MINQFKMVPSTTDLDKVGPETISAWLPAQKVVIVVTNEGNIQVWSRDGAIHEVSVSFQDLIQRR